jgi:hypothetical protein
MHSRRSSVDRAGPGAIVDKVCSGRDRIPNILTTMGCNQSDGDLRRGELIVCNVASAVITPRLQGAQVSEERNGQPARTGSRLEPLQRQDGSSMAALAKVPGVACLPPTYQGVSDMHKVPATRTVEEAIRDIAAMKPNYAPSFNGRLEQQLQAASNWCLALGGAALLAVFVAASAVIGGAPVSLLKAPALVLALLCQVMGCAGMLTKTLADIASLISLHFREADVRQQEYCYDAAYAGKLRTYSPQVLSQADQWLAAKIARIERRTTMIVGGSQPLALLSLVATGWLFGEKAILFMSEHPQLTDGVFICGAFFAGLAIGAFTVLQVRNRLAYQREIVAFAMAEHRAPPPHLESGASPSAAPGSAPSLGTLSLKAAD